MGGGAAYENKAFGFVGNSGQGRDCIYDTFGGKDMSGWGDLIVFWNDGRIDPVEREARFH